MQLLAPLVQSDISYKLAHYTSHSPQTANLNVMKLKQVESSSLKVSVGLPEVGGDEQLFQPEQLQEDETRGLSALS